MNVLRYEEDMNTSDVQMWNNDAFDNGESEDSSTIRTSWCPHKYLIPNPSDSIDSISSKENRSPALLRSPNPVKPKVIPKQILAENKVLLNEQIVRDEKKIDDEIEEIEKEISRLSSQLKILKVEKADRHNLKFVERRVSGRVVPAKFMESKQVLKNSVKKTEEASSIFAKSEIRRRGFTMGPAEIMAAGVRRGMSLGTGEISAGAKPRQLGKTEATPVHPPSARRKSSMWKLQGIDVKMGKIERKTSLSLSPKSRKMVCKVQSTRQAVTSVASNKILKKEDAVLASIQPKKLFKDGGDKSGPAKKPAIQQGRVVSSRYNQSTIQYASKSAMKKRSSLENDEDGTKALDKISAESVGKSRVKKRWEIPSELVVNNEKFEVENAPISISVMADKLPRIKILRCENANDAGRDSGPAKRVAELVGKKTFFSDDDEDEVPFVCQTLKFDEEFE